MRSLTIALSVGGLLVLALQAPARADPDRRGVELWARPLGRKASIRAAPRRAAPSIGEVRRGAAAAVAPSPVAQDDRARGRRRGRRGCSAWLRVIPTGFLCRDEVSLGQAPPEDPGEEARRRYRYAVVRSERAPLYADPAGQVPAGALGRGDGLTLTSARGGLWRTTTRRYVRRADVEIVSAPAPRGQDLRALQRDARYRLGWLVPDPGAHEVPLFLPARLAAASPASAAAAAAEGAGEARPLPRYTLARVLQDGPPGPGPGPGPGNVLVEVRLGRQEDGGEVLRGAVRARHLRRLLPAPIPQDLRPGERWIDISLSQQVAAAYEGDEPVFATLVSTGRRGGTPPGTFYIERKYRAQTMANVQGAASRYDFRQVPWAQFFHGRIGLHAVLWHDQLGHPVSHGCVNLSPPDAERFFTFTDPPLPPGWHSVRPPAPAPDSIDAAPGPGDAGGTRVLVRR